MWRLNIGSQVEEVQRCHSASCLEGRLRVGPWTTLDTAPLQYRPGHSPSPPWTQPLSSATLDTAPIQYWTQPLSSVFNSWCLLIHVMHLHFHLSWTCRSCPNPPLILLLMSTCFNRNDTVTRKEKNNPVWNEITCSENNCNSPKFFERAPNLLWHLYEITHISFHLF